MSIIWLGCDLSLKNIGLAKKAKRYIMLNVFEDF